MKNRKLVFRYIVLLIVQLFTVQCFSQWRVEGTVSKANCIEEGGLGGSILVQVSGMSPPYTYTWTNSSTSQSLDNIGPGNYTLTVQDMGAHDTSVAFIVSQGACDPAPEIAFSPNGDGINDTWEISNTSLYPNLQLTVYNRVGQVVYEHKGNYVPWGGLSLIGLPVDGGTYFYIIYEDWNNTKNTGIVKGSVNIVR